VPTAGPNDRGDVAVSEDKQVTVLVVDDQASFRAAMRELVDATDGFTLVGEASSGQAALDAVDELAPLLVIMDKRMPGMDGVETTRLLVARHPEVVVLLISVEEPDAELMRSRGAAAFARKGDLSKRLLREVWREHGRGRSVADKRQRQP
jgi:DNA-binding NarL/FixJ family response regulator